MHTQCLDLQACKKLEHRGVKEREEMHKLYS